MNFVFHIFVSLSVDNFSLRKSATSPTCKTLATSFKNQKALRQLFTWTTSRSVDSFARWAAIVTVTVVLVACASTNWTKYWPCSNIHPNQVKKQLPKDFEDCLQKLDLILKDEAKTNFKNEDSTIAVINIADGQGGIGGFFINNWYLNYKYITNPSNGVYVFNFPTETPPVVKQFSNQGIIDPCAMIRIVFSCYYKKLNNKTYDWNEEITTLKKYWINPETINWYVSKQMKHREDSILNAYEFNKMLAGDTVVCWLRQPPRIFSKKPDSYYLTATINEKRAPSKIINVKMTNIQSDKKSNGYLLGDRTLVVGDTLSDYAINWHQKHRKYFHYSQNTYWP